METILFLCPSLEGAGVERRVCILLKYLDRKNYRYALGLLRHQGHFLSEIDQNLIVYVEQPRWLKVLVYPFKWFKNFQNVFYSIYQINRLIRQVKPSLIFTFTLETTIPAFFVKTLFRHEKVKWIISEDSNTPEAIADFLKYPLPIMAGLKVLSIVYKRADWVSAVSNAVKKSLIEGYQLSEQSIRVIHNPIDRQAIYSKLDPDSRNPLGEDYLLAVGRLDKVKQYDLLLEAFALLRKKTTIKLIILGEGREEGRLRALSEGLGSDGDVLFLGFNSNPWCYMKHARLLLLTSRQEGFSNVIAEAMVVGCPVISTRAGGPEDIITENKTGILVNHNAEEIADATLRLLNSKTARQCLVGMAQQCAGRFSSETICWQVLAMFDDVLLNRGALL